jgi:hypothetical protein
MKRLTFLLVFIALVAFTFTLLASSNRARPAGAEPCGCSADCMGGKKCAISCPVGTAAHCECIGGSQTSPSEPKCYCR